MNNKFKVSEEEKNRIKGLHHINEQSGFVTKQEGSDRLDKFNSRQDVGEQSRNTDAVKSTSSETSPDSETEWNPLEWLKNMGDLTNNLTEEILMEYCKHSHRGGCPRACGTDKPVLKALHSWCQSGKGTDGQRI